MANKYANILSLEDAKRYLRLDSDFTDDDSDIEMMIESAFDFISKHTNYIFSPRDKTYKSVAESFYGNGDCEPICVFDYPINTTEFADKVPLYYSGFVKFLNTESITLNVGFSSRFDDDFPTSLIMCAKQMISVYYYQAEKNVDNTLMPPNVMEIIDTYRRFIAV